MRIIQVQIISREIISTVEGVGWRGGGGPFVDRLTVLVELTYPNFLKLTKNIIVIL